MLPRTTRTFGSPMRLPSGLTKLCGRRITQVARVLFERDGALDARDGAVELHWEEGVVLLDGAADGEGLRVAEAAWQDPFVLPLSPGNQAYVLEHGKWRWVDCSAWEGYRELIGTPVSRVRALANEAGRLAGVYLSVPGRDVWIVVEGDECHVHWVHPIGFTAVGLARSRPPDGGA